MKENHEYIDLYSGTEVSVILLNSLLKEAGIHGMIQNDLESGRLAGFAAGTPSTIRVKVLKSDTDKAFSVLKDFLQNHA